MPLPASTESPIPSQSSHTSVDHTSHYPTYTPTLGRYRDEHDVLPQAPLAPLADLETPAADPTPALAQIRRIRRRVNPKPVPYTTLPDAFGQYRVYAANPRSIPDASCELDNVSDIRVPSNPLNPSTLLPVSEIISPCPNISAFRLQYWHWNQGEKKSKGARESLVRDVISAPDFVPSDIIGLDWRQMDKSLATGSPESSPGWKTSSIPITIPPRTPAAAVASKSHPERNLILLPNFRYRSLTSIVVDAFSKNNPLFFHYLPYKALFKDPLTAKIYQAYGEVYESQRMGDAYEEIQKIKLDEPCTLPRCPAMLMIFSDATQLANFGRATAWPIRVAFGNLSKYERCKPQSRNHYEVGYMPSVSLFNTDSFTRWNNI